MSLASAAAAIEVDGSDELPFDDEESVSTGIGDDDEMEASVELGCVVVTVDWELSLFVEEAEMGWEVEVENWVGSVV